MLWYNPPYCSNININLGKEFLRLVDKHFPDNHYYRKIFNRKTLKISYSCMNNVKSIIQSHNNFILSKYNEITTQNTKSNNKHLTINRNYNNTNFDNTNVINISLDSNSNSILNNYNRPITRSVSKSLIKSINTVIPNDLCSINNNNIVRNSDNSINNDNNITYNINNNNNSRGDQNDSTFTNINNKVIKPGFKSKYKVNNNCNCRKSNKLNCPLNGNCLIKNVVYKVRVKCNLSDNKKNNYYNNDKNKNND